MIDRRWGRIINITGKSEPEHLNAAFSAKAALHAWAKGLSREVGQFGVTVNSIPPGRIMSEQIRRNYPEDFRKSIRRDGDPRALLGRTGGPGGDGGLARLAAGALHHGNGDPGGWRIAALSVLRGRIMRQMVLVGFLQAQNCTTLASAWRHPESRTDFTTAAYYQKIGQVLEEGKFQLALLRRQAGDAGHL